MRNLFYVQEWYKQSRKTKAERENTAAVGTPTVTAHTRKRHARIVAVCALIAVVLFFVTLVIYIRTR